jgi:hypothetical protein
MSFDEEIFLDCIQEITQNNVKLEYKDTEMKEVIDIEELEEIEIYRDGTSIMMLSADEMLNIFTYFKFEDILPLNLVNKCWRNLLSKKKNLKL